MLKEFLTEQLPILVGVSVAALIISYLQAGYLPLSGRPFPVAGVEVSLFHLVLMGFVTGYLMALVGEASGILSLPYSMVVLNFTNISISPTSLIMTFLNPFGSLFGFRREGQWNLDLARWLCIGAFLGAPIGPFIRFYVLDDPDLFKAVIGGILLFLGVFLWIQITPWYKRRLASKNPQAAHGKTGTPSTASLGASATASTGGSDSLGAPATASAGGSIDSSSGDLPHTANGASARDFAIKTVATSLRRLTIYYGGKTGGVTHTLSVPLLFVTGCIVGIVASSIGVGGGFMLVPILATVFGLPMYVLVAGTIPFVITLSCVGLLSYTLIVPALTGVLTSPDWGFGLFAAVGAIAGSWCAAKTQRYFPEGILKPLLGTVTGALAILLIVNYFVTLPFSL